MSRRSPRIAAILLLLALSRGEARAGGGVWSPLGGYAVVSDDGGLTIQFATFYDASLEIGYNPVDRSNNDLGFSIPGIGNVATTMSLSYSVGPGSFTLSGGGIHGTLDVTLFGDVGPTTPDGLPLSLDGFGSAQGSGTGPFRSDLGFFSFSSAPEPSSLLMLALGIGGISLAMVVRRTRA